MANIAQRNFAGGELSPSLYARTDQVKYATALRRCRNWVVQQHGGVTNRAGTQYVAAVKDEARVTRLIPWVYNDSQTYVLEFSHLFLRFHKNGAPLLSGGTPYQIASPYSEADLRAIKFAQSADVMTLVHKGYVPMELARIAETNWTLVPVPLGPAIASPTNLTRASGGLISVSPTAWYVTAVSSTTGEESLAASYSANFIGDPANAVVLTWTTVAGASDYRVYREYQTRNYAGGIGAGSIGFIGTAKTGTFSDTNTAANYEIQPPKVSQSADFNAGGEYPAATNYYQQRQVFGGSTLEPETMWLSRSADYGNFITSTPMRDDDAVEFTIVGKQVNEIRALLDLDPLIIFTSGGEWIVRGDEAGIILPTEVNLRQFSYHGIHEYLPPVIAGTVPLFIQARGNAIRKLVAKNDTEDAGADLTIYARHLFRDFTIIDWDYSELPDSVVWVVRSDGKLLGLTFLPNEGIWGWHWHDTDGLVENVCVVPEGVNDAVYLIVKRTINGATRRFVERMATRRFTDEVNAFFVDSGLTYDGRNTSATTMTLTTATGWLSTDLLTITRSVAGFVAGDVGNEIWFTAADGPVRVRITAYTSTTVVTGYAHRTVPAALRAAATATWTRAVDDIAGLGHLEAKSLSILGDGFVVASPNNPKFSAKVVAAGVVTLDKPYGVIHAGLPYISDLETLDFDTPQGSSIKDRKRNVNKLGIVTEETVGLFAGMDEPGSTETAVGGLQELKVRERENLNDPNTPVTGLLDVNIESTWNHNGRIFIRQVDPLPATVLSVIPTGYLG